MALPGLIFWFSFPGIITIICFTIPSHYLASKPRKSSYGVLSYLDTAFLDWTIGLVRGGIVSNDHWLLKCPGLFGCAPRVCTLDADRLIVGQLLDMTPAGGFAYVLTRRVAEAVAQTVCCWLVPGWLTALAVAVCTTWVQQIVSWKGSRGRRRGGTLLGFNPKHVYLLLSVVPLTILVPFLIETAYGGVLDFQLQFLTAPEESSFWTFWKVYGLARSEVTPSILDLLQVGSLAQILYGRSHPSSLPRSTPRQRLCLQTRVTLMYWSSLVFVAAVFLLVLLVFRVLVLGPFMRVIGSLTTHKPGDPLTPAKRKKKNADENVSEHCSKKVLEPGEKREPSVLNFSTSLDSVKDSHSTSEKLMKQLDNYDYPDPEILFTERGDSRGNTQPTEHRHNPSHESGDGQDRECPQSSFSVPVAPRFISRAISANLESDSSDEEEE